MLYMYGILSISPLMLYMYGILSISPLMLYMYGILSLSPLMLYMYGILSISPLMKHHYSYFAEHSRLTSVSMFSRQHDIIDVVTQTTESGSERRNNEQTNGDILQFVNRINDKQLQYFP